MYRAARIGLCARPQQIKQHAISRPFASQATTLNFDDARSAFQSKTTAELLLHSAVLKVCSFDVIVRNSDALLKMGETVFGKHILTERVLRPTFFDHFCAGTSASDIVPRIERLHANGIGGILDYAAEADVVSEDEQAAPGVNVLDHPKWSADGGAQSAKVYCYTSEQECDANVQIFLDCIQAVKDTTPEGFAAIKLTALGNPLLLERLTESILAIRTFFDEFDRDGDGSITFAEFEAGWARHFHPLPDGQLRDLFDRTRSPSPASGRAPLPDAEGYVDFVDWCSRLDPLELPQLVALCLDDGPLARAAPTEEEAGLMRRMIERLDTLAAAAEKAGVRLMVDAEQTYFQPAIDHLVLRLQRKYNTGDHPTVLNTYQCYLKHTDQRVADDLERARRDGFRWGAKLVRGAYLVAERQRAREHGYEDPTQPSLEATHACYDGCVRLVLEQSVARGEGSNVLIASHNQQSVEGALARMAALGIDRESGGVYFGQLLGMADHLSFTLGSGGYKVYKYVPYGPVDEVLPYLVRRAQENSGMMGSPAIQHEAEMVDDEVHRRLPLLRPAAFASAAGAAATLLSTLLL